MMPVLALAAATATTFNLVCAVHTVDGVMSPALIASLKDAPVASEEFRVDLDRLRWCTGKCLTTKPIVSFDDAEIIFVANPRQSANDAFSGIKVDRETGDLTQVVGGAANFVVLTGGKCTAEPFTGMPQPKF